MSNADKIILHLCAKEGSDSKPYRDAGYDVRIIGEEIGVENFSPPSNVYGIIANPPCTQFSMLRGTPKSPRDLREGMRLVKEVLRIIWECQYACTGPCNQPPPLKFWMLENPSTGFLSWFLGKPNFVYSQHEYGALHTKRTGLWGYFNHPKRPILSNPLPAGSTLSKCGDTGRHDDKDGRRSHCPINFAMAFFEANPWLFERNADAISTITVVVSTKILSGAPSLDSRHYGHRI